MLAVRSPRRITTSLAFEGHRSHEGLTPPAGAPVRGDCTVAELRRRPRARRRSIDAASGVSTGSLAVRRAAPRPDRSRWRGATVADGVVTPA